MNYVDLKDLYIFSGTAKIDDTYKPLIEYILKNTTGKVWIIKGIDWELIKTIWDEQEKIKAYNMTQPRNKMLPVKKILFIYDDVIGDQKLKSYQSDLCSFSCISWHSNILNIYIT